MLYVPVFKQPIIFFVFNGYSLHSANIKVKGQRTEEKLKGNLFPVFRVYVGKKLHKRTC